MFPKPLQNRSWSGSGGHLGAIFETRCFQDLFLMILTPCWDPLWDQLGLIWGTMFLIFFKWLFDGLGLHLGSQNTSKIRPKRESKPKAEIHWFCFYLLHFGHIQGCWKRYFFDVCLEPCFDRALGAHFDDLVSFWGVPFGDHVHHFLGTIFASIFRPP